jgi:hypothetical protein
LYPVPRKAFPGPARLTRAFLSDGLITTAPRFSSSLCEDYAPDMSERLPASVLLKDLLNDATADQVTLGWLIARLGDRSFGIVMLLLALLGLVPGASPFVAVLLAVPAVQMILARPGPVFPRRVVSRNFRTQQLARVFRLTVPVLSRVEKFIHPRWPTPFETTKRIIGAVVLLLGGLLLAPVPLSNIAPSLVIILIALAYLEGDGVLLCVALVVSALVLTAAAAAIWQIMGVAGWVDRLF